MLLSFADSISLARESAGYSTPLSLQLAYFVLFASLFQELHLLSDSEKAAIYALHARTISALCRCTARELEDIIKHFDYVCSSAKQYVKGGHSYLSFYLYSVERQVRGDALPDDCSDLVEDCLRVTEKAVYDELMSIRDALLD